MTLRGKILVPASLIVGIWAIDQILGVAASEQVTNTFGALVIFFFCAGTLGYYFGKQVKQTEIDNERSIELNEKAQQALKQQHAAEQSRGEQH